MAETAGVLDIWCKKGKRGFCGCHMCRCGIRDGISAGGSRGAAIGHVSPEAAQGGPIGIIEDGDTIIIDIPNGILKVDLTDDEILSVKYIQAQCFL